MNDKVKSYNDIIRRNFEKADWESAWLLLILSLATICVVFLACFMFASKEVRCYYPLASIVGHHPSLSVKSDINWGEDRSAFTTTDPAELYEFMSKVSVCAAK